MNDKNKKVLVCVADIGIIIFFALIPLFAKLMIDLIPDCAFARLGIPCPSCGATRCVQSLFSGDIPSAFAYNPFIFLLIFYTAAVLLIWNASTFLKSALIKRIFKLLANWIAVIIIAIGFAVFGILRAIFAIM